MNDARDRLLSSPIYSDAVERLIGKLLVPDNLTSNERKECLAEMTTLYFDEHQMFMNQTGILNNDTMWLAAGKNDFVVACRWRHTWTLPRTKVLGKLACLVLSKKLGIGTAERNWKQMKKIKHRDRANLRNKVTAKITNVYGQYQQVKLRNRDDQRSSVGRLWTEEDLHCMKMDVFCSNIAKSLDTDARIRTLRTFVTGTKVGNSCSRG
jgi:hypothetical protein